MIIERTAARLALAAAAAVLVAGCAGTGGYRNIVSAGSAVELHQALRLPAGSARVHIQGGRVVSEAEINRFLVHCSFGLRRQGDEPLVDTIEPDRFELVRPSRSGYWVERSGDDGVQVAARGLLTAGMLFEDDGPPEYLFYTELPLRSERQPQVDDLTCRYDAAQFPYIAGDPPTLDQINATLGEIATVRAAGAADG